MRIMFIYTGNFHEKRRFDIKKILEPLDLSHTMRPVRFQFDDLVS